MLIKQYLEPPGDLVPYAILLCNYIIFNTLRRFASALLFVKPTTSKTNLINSDKSKNKQELQTGFKRKLLKLFICELISTCELCVQCAELNVVHEKHGSFAYGVALAFLTNLWLNTFGDAHTTPGYLIEDIFCSNSTNKQSATKSLLSFVNKPLLKSWLTYIRLGGQFLAMPLAWRLASIYWRYQLLEEHSKLVAINTNDANCHSSLATSTMLGLAIELVCSMLCRLLELIAAQSVQLGWLLERTSNLLIAILSSLLVVLALDSSGGYFNPVLASSLEFGCSGVSLSQHLLVFWLGPLLGHVLARSIHEKYFKSDKQQEACNAKSTATSARKRAKPLPSPIVRRVTRRSSKTLTTLY